MQPYEKKEYIGKWLLIWCVILSLALSLIIGFLSNQILSVFRSEFGSVCLLILVFVSFAVSKLLSKQEKIDNKNDKRLFLILFADFLTLATMSLIISESLFKIYPLGIPVALSIMVFICLLLTLNLFGKPTLTPHNEVALAKTDGEQDKGRFIDKVEKMAADISSIKTDLTVMKPNYVNKKDIASLRAEIHRTALVQTKWIVVMLIGAVALAIAMAKLLL